MNSKEKNKLKKFNKWKKRYFKELKKKCEECQFKPDLCNHCFNSEVTIINQKIEEFEIKELIKKLEYDIR